jgi:photosystem II stability/assembly factor-like uncharacterized protein
MKTKILTFSAFILVGINTLFGQWVEQNPGINEIFEQIECINSTTCFICADNSTMLKTTDGSTWVDKSNGIPSGIFLHQLQAIDEDTVFSIGDGNFYRTVDGGENWTEVPLAVGGNFHFINSNIGYANNGGDLYKTTDKGDTWNLVKVDGGGLPFFVNENVGFLVRPDWVNLDLKRIYKTIDGGLNQVIVYEYNSSTTSITDIQMVTDQIGYACSSNGKILKTINGGDNWNELTHPFQGTALLTSLDFINSTNGYVIGNSGAVLKTTDGGNSWIDESHTVQYGQKEISVASLDTAYIAVMAGNFIFKNSDANLSAKITENGLEIGKLFPNPAHDLLNVSIKKANTSIKVYDLVGNMMQEQKLIQNQNNIINLSEFTNGVYLYEIWENSIPLSTGKFIKN